MEEDRSLDNAMAEHGAVSLDITDPTNFLKEPKENHEVSLSATIEGVLKESANVPETERNPAEKRQQIAPEDVPPKLSSSVPPETSAAPFDDPTSLPPPIVPNAQTKLTDTPETENVCPVEEKFPSALYPIPEDTLPPSERVAVTPTASEPTSPESELVPDPSRLPAESENGPADNDTIIISVKVYSDPSKERLAPKEVLPSQEDMDVNFPKVHSSERLSVATAINESASTGSDNDIFVSIKPSNENAVDPQPEVGNEPSSIQTLAALQKIMPSNLSEDAIHLFKAASEKLFKERIEGPKTESQDFSAVKDATNEEDDAIRSADSVKHFGETRVVSPVKDIEESIDEGICKKGEKAETVVSSNLNSPPIVIDSLDEPLIDVIDTSPTEDHIRPTAVHTNATEVRTSLTEVREKPEDLNQRIPETSQPEARLAQAEINLLKLADTSEEVLKVTEDPAISESASRALEKPTDVPIRQRDCSEDRAKKQSSKTRVKTVKLVAKGATLLPSNLQVANPGQNGSIAATASSSATSALSPKSEKSLKQLKTSRPASASSTRGLFGDFSSPLCGSVTTPMTGPQRVAAARAAAAASGIKRKVPSFTSPSAPADGARSPREKPSVTSTSSIGNVSASTTTNASSTAQKRTSAMPGSTTTSAHHLNAARRGAASDGHRPTGHGGLSHLGIHSSHQKLKNSNDIKSLEETYSTVLKSFVDAKKDIKQKTKLALEIFTEVERLRHIASTKFGKDLPLTEDVSGLAEVTAVTPPTAGSGEQTFSGEENRTIAAAEAVLKALTSPKTFLLSEALQHHTNLLACCCEATGDEGSARLISEKEFADEIVARMSKAAELEQSRVAEVLHLFRTSLLDLDETKATVRDLRSQLELLNQENSTLTCSLGDCTKLLEESRTEFGKVTARKNALEKEAKILRLKLKDAETKAAAEEQKHKDLSSQLRILEEKLRMKETMQEQRVKETERKLRERLAKEQGEKQRRFNESLNQQLKESELEATCQQLETELGSVTQLLEIQTKDKEKLEEELKVTTEKLSRLAMHRRGETEISRSERESILQRLNSMIAGEDISNGPKLREELQTLADLLNERERLITEKDSEIKKLKDSCNESGDSIVSKEDYQALQDTLSKLSAHNHLLEQELSKMIQAAAKRDRVMSEQEKVLVIRDQLIALLQGSNHPAGNASSSGADANHVAIQKRMLELQTTVERQTVRIKALEAQLAMTEEHQDGLQNLRTRYERRIAQLERALTDHRVAHRSETITKLRTLLQNNLGQ